jgi:hypothetical protein
MIDMILISTRYTFFSRSSSKKNSILSVLGLERFEDGWSTGKSFSGAHEWGQSAKKWLVLVCGASLDICDILAQGLIGLIGYSYKQGIHYFPEAHLKRTLG